MIQIRPVSDLRNKYPEVERLVTQQQQPVFLTKNGYGSICPAIRSFVSGKASDISFCYGHFLFVGLLY